MKQDYTYQQPTGGQSYSPINPASTLRRIAAYIIDIILIGLIQGLIIGILFFMGFFSFQMFLQPSSPGFGSFFGGLQLAFTSLSAIIQLGYFTLMESEKFSGATLGKKLLSIKVVGENGKEVDIEPSFIRNLARLLWSIPCVGFIILIVDVILIHEDGQRIGDRIADTYVVKESASGQGYSQYQQDYSSYGQGKDQGPGGSKKTPPPPKPTEERTQSKQRSEPSQPSTKPPEPSKSSKGKFGETKEREKPPSPDEGSKTCPKCGKESLVVSANGSKYCTNCDYTHWD